MEYNINEYFDRDEMSLNDWEMLLEAGWDRVGSYFFHRRYDVYSHPFYPDDMYIRMQLMPLRYRLQGFKFSKSQRIIARKNSDLKRVFGPVNLTDEKLILFSEWYRRRFFTEGSIFTWVSGIDKPFPTHEVALYKDDRLIACSFFDLTKNFQYSTTAMYDPNEMKRSLGTFTMMSEIEHGIATRKRYHYPGHAYYENSIYDYKKRFGNKEGFDWDNKTWRKLDL